MGVIVMIMPITMTVAVVVMAMAVMLLLVVIRSLGLRLALGVDAKHQGGIHNTAADGQGFSPSSQLRCKVLPHGLELIRFETVATADQHQIS